MKIDVPRLGNRHFYAFEYVDGGVDDTIRAIYIYDNAKERDASINHLSRLGRIARPTGSREARVYMVQRIRLLSPNSGIAVRQGAYSIDQIIEVFQKIVNGIQTLF